VLADGDSASVHELVEVAGVVVFAEVGDDARASSSPRAGRRAVDVEASGRRSRGIVGARRVKAYVRKDMCLF
jgi:hypothetical protein